MNKEVPRQPDIERLTADYRKMSHDLSLLRVQATKQASVLRAIADVLDAQDTNDPLIVDSLPKSGDLKRLMETRAEVAGLRNQLKASLTQAGVKVDD